MRPDLINLIADHATLPRVLSHFTEKGFTEGEARLFLHDLGIDFPPMLNEERLRQRELQEMSVVE